MRIAAADFVGGDSVGGVEAMLDHSLPLTTAS